MRALVTNRAGGPRGFQTRDRGTVLLEAGESATLDLAAHPSHDAWAASGEVALVPEGDAAEDKPRPAGRVPPARPRRAEGVDPDRGRATRGAG